MPSFAGSPNLTTFSADERNLFTGSIPDLSAEFMLQFFEVSQNALSGTIPNLPSSLKVLIVSGNGLTGSLPNLPAGMMVLQVDTNKLSGALPAPPAALTFGESTLCPEPVSYTKLRMMWIGPLRRITHTPGASSWWGLNGGGCDLIFKNNFQ